MYSLISKLIKTITFTKLLIWTTAATVGVVALTIFENRTEILSSSAIGSTTKDISLAGISFRVGKDSQARIKKFIDYEPEIVAMSVSSIDIRLNIRRVLHYYADDTLGVSKDEVKRDLEIIQNLPLFTTDDANNRQIIKLINGQFSCVGYSSTTVAKVTPALHPGVVTACRISLPPYYGYFSGFITAYLQYDPSLDEQLRLKTEMNAIATEIYFRDVVTSAESK